MKWMNQAIRTCLFQSIQNVFETFKHIKQQAHRLLCRCFGVLNEHNDKSNFRFFNLLIETKCRSHFSAIRVCSRQFSPLLYMYIFFHLFLSVSFPLTLHLYLLFRFLMPNEYCGNWKPMKTIQHNATPKPEN